MEDALRVLARGELAERHCLVVGCGRIFGFADLYDGASAVPSVRRVVFLPEGGCDGERDTVEGSVFGPDAVVVGGINGKLPQELLYVFSG